MNRRLLLLAAIVLSVTTFYVFLIPQDTLNSASSNDPSSHQQEASDSALLARQGLPETTDQGTDQGGRYSDRFAYQTGPEAGYFDDGLNSAPTSDPVAEPEASDLPMEEAEFYQMLDTTLATVMEGRLTSEELIQQEFDKIRAIINASRTARSIVLEEYKAIPGHETVEKYFFDEIINGSNYGPEMLLQVAQDIFEARDESNYEHMFRHLSNFGEFDPEVTDLALELVPFDDEDLHDISAMTYLEKLAETGNRQEADIEREQAIHDYQNAALQVLDAKFRESPFADAKAESLKTYFKLQTNDPTYEEQLALQALESNDLQLITEVLYAIDNTALEPSTVLKNSLMDRFFFSGGNAATVNDGEQLVQDAAFTLANYFDLSPSEQSRVVGVVRQSQ
jgi:hypothetical protein